MYFSNTYMILFTFYHNFLCALSFYVSLYVTIYFYFILLNIKYLFQDSNFTK